MKRPIAYCLAFYLLGNLFYENIIISSMFVAIWVIFLYRKNKSVIVFGFVIFFVIGIFGRYSVEKHKVDVIETAIDKKYIATASTYIKEVDKVYGEYTRLVLEMKNLRLGGNTYKTGEKIQSYIRYTGDIYVGDSVEIKGTFYRTKEARNKGQFDENAYMKTRKIYYKFYGDVVTYKKNPYNLDKFLNNTKQNAMNITNKLMPPKEAGLVNSMILGDKNSLDGDLKKLYSDVGISHIIAISGMHILVLCLIIYKVLSLLKVNKKVNAVISMLFLIFYALLTGGSPSAIRAVVMGCVMLFADVIGREKDNYSNISFAALVLIIYNPSVVHDIGFLLSFAAVSGIITTVPLLDKLYVCPKVIKEILSSSVAAIIWTTPIIAYYFYEIPTYSLIANILVVPLSSILLIVSIVGMLIGIVWVGLAKIIMLVVYYILVYNEMVSTYLVNLGYAKVVTGQPNIYVIILYYVLIILIVLYFSQDKEVKEKLKEYCVDVVFAITLIIMIIQIWPKSFNIEILDVGQGDSIVINTPKDKHVLIDGGGDINIEDAQGNTGKNIVDKYMKYSGIRKLDAVFVTHPDFDHIKGVIEIVDLMKVDKLILTIGKANETELQKELINKAKDKKIPIYYFKQGDFMTIDDLRITCIYPDLDVDTYAKGNNDYSLVLKVDYKEKSILFMGDISEENEKKIINKYKNLDVDLIKVAHHGSKYATMNEFLERVRPEYAVISVGRNNYGHPGIETLERLANHTVETYITKERGAVTVQYENEKLVVK
ncbi:MAG TPA: DNA internalization-related competence protein ComEC/Rec2 [Clostridiales bacterium]|nr:MAG: DNA internalization-related competence protein ComEC/Rec2 [Clostridiales bacterium GWD2_32_19]HCC07899.1 DNA internalization-related competence protein ComEC/Rec2 [Clostridiales bacterium]